jgi:hypothetical protein
MITPALQEKIDNGYDFRIGYYISEGFSIFSKNAGGFIGYGILAFLLSMLCAFIPFANFLIPPCLIVGFFLVAKKINKGEHTEFSDFFRGFDFFGQIALYQLVWIGIIILVILPIFFVLGFYGLTQAIAGSVHEIEQITSKSLGIVWACYILAVTFGLIYLGVALVFVTQLICFHKMNFWDAFNLSRQIITANWFAVFLFLIALFFINLLAVIPCGLGLLVTIPATYIAMYVAFEDIVGTDSFRTDEVDFI